jgi:hypothetical protein
MVKLSEIVTTAPHSLISAASKPASHSVVASHAGDGSVTNALQLAHEPALDACCLWCGRDFTPRVTGGSVQKFCCTGHRQEFWIAARRWTMRAIDAGLLSVDCLKASHASVHAAGGGVLVGERPQLTSSLARATCELRRTGLRAPIRCGQGLRNASRLPCSV